MDIQTQKCWFSDLDRPDTSDLTKSVGYLDRMIGHHSKMQFLAPPIQRNKTHKSNKPKVSRKENKSQVTTKRSYLVDVDDEEWIENRKRRFPKRGEPQNVEDTSPDTDTIDQKIDCQPSSSVDTPDKSHRKSKSHPGRKSVEVTGRKKTLFEKLMDQD